MWKALTIISMVVSVAACVVAVQAVRGRDSAVRRAIKQHEAETLQRYLPLLRRIAESGDDDRLLALNPQTVDELIRALAEVARSRATPAALAEQAADAMREIEEASALKVETRADGVFDMRAKQSWPTARPAIRTGGNGTIAAVQSSNTVDPGTLDDSIILEGEVALEVRHPTIGSDLFLLRLPSTDPQPLLLRSDSDAWPVWSPDGRQIVLAASRKRRVDVFLFDPYNDQRGRQLTALTHTADVESWLTWSPDGERIAFELSDREHRGIRIMNVNAPDDLTTLTESGRQPAWSPDGERIMFTRPPPSDGGPTIFTANPDGSDERVLYHDDQPLTFTLAPRWSPDGRSVFATRTSFSVGNDASSHELVIINSESGAARVIRSPCDRAWGLTWSPDGRFVLACSMHADQPSTLHVIAVADGRHRVLAKLPAFVASASWKCSDQPR